MLSNTELWPKSHSGAVSGAESRNQLFRFPTTVPATTQHSLPLPTCLLTSTPDTAEGRAESQTSHLKDIVVGG